MEDSFIFYIYFTLKRYRMSLLFMRENNFTERLLAIPVHYFLLSPRGKTARVASYEISRARLSSLSDRSVDRFIRTFDGERYAERCKNSLAPAEQNAS